MAGRRSNLNLTRLFMEDEIASPSARNDKSLCPGYSDEVLAIECRLGGWIPALAGMELEIETGSETLTQFFMGKEGFGC